MKDVKVVFAVFREKGKYTVKYDKSAVRGVLALSKVLFKEACRLIFFYNETNKKGVKKK